MPQNKKKTAAKKEPLKKIVLAQTPVAEKQQVDGKDYEAPKARPRTLADLWGYKGDPFGTDEEEVYKAKLSKLNKADLQRDCIKIGLMPHDSRQIMCERLIKQFRQHTAARKSINIQPIEVPNPDEASEALRSWMASAGGNVLR